MRGEDEDEALSQELAAYPKSGMYEKNGALLWEAQGYIPQSELFHVSKKAVVRIIDTYERDQEALVFIVEGRVVTTYLLSTLTFKKLERALDRKPNLGGKKWWVRAEIRERSVDESPLYIFTVDGRELKFDTLTGRELSAQLTYASGVSHALGLLWSAVTRGKI
jgi:hypothetical protein